MNRDAQIIRAVVKSLAIIRDLDTAIQWSKSMENTRRILLAGANELVRAANCFDAIRKLKGDEDGRLEKLIISERETAEELRRMAMADFVGERKVAS